MKPLLVGERPSRSNDLYWRTPLSGVAARALCRTAGFPSYGYETWTHVLYDRFDCENAQLRYGPWSTSAAAARLQEVIADEREVIVFCGIRALEAYVEMITPASVPDVEQLEMYQWAIDHSSPTGRREVALLPAVGALTRNYGDPLVSAGVSKARADAGRVLNEAIEKAARFQETMLQWPGT